MRTIRHWQGVRMRQVAASADPDSPPRLVTIPVAWDDSAATALASLAPGEGPVHLAGATAAWITLVGQRARAAGAEPGLTEILHRLLRQRQAAPNAPIWRGETGNPGFTLNLAAFHDVMQGFDSPAFAAAATAVTQACRLLAPQTTHMQIGLAGLDDLLACLGLAYDSRAARALAACLAALLRARVELALEGPQADLLATPATWPAPPATCPIPGLAQAAALARSQVRIAADTLPATGIFPPGPVEALLGIETGGLAPAFSPVRDGHLSRAAEYRLAASSMSPEAALAAVLLGDNPLPVADQAAHAAMLAAVTPYLHVAPSLPATLPAMEGETRSTAGTSAPVARPLPPRHRGFAQKASVGGHRVFLRTGEYEDGALGEISVSLPRENPAFRGLMECFANAVSIGLQHGVKLETFVENFVLTQFGPAGTVEGDPAVARATSLIDYIFRNLSANYLARPLADPEMDIAEAPQGDTGAPMLPLDLPRGARARRTALRLVA